MPPTNGSRAKFSSHNPIPGAPAMTQMLATIHQASLGDAWLTIGTFDGVHLGHQEIISGLAAGAHAAGLQAVVITFHPHPLSIVRHRHSPHLLTLPEERARYLGEAGADLVITQPFDAQIANTSAVDFLTLLKEHFNFSHLRVGYDFAFGHHREGNLERLRELEGAFGYSLEVVPPVKVHGEIVSSRKIRAMLAEGKVEQAAGMLGRSYQLSGEVVRGDGRGRTLGIPTANLHIPEEKLIPLGGVYACVAQIGPASRPAAVNIGVRPTFDGSLLPLQVEAHLLDHQEDIYGQQVSLRFIARLRGEKRFANVQELVAQIHYDVQQTRELIPTSLLST